MAALGAEASKIEGGFWVQIMPGVLGPGVAKGRGPQGILDIFLREVPLSSLQMMKMPGLHRKVGGGQDEALE